MVDRGPGCGCGCGRAGTRYQTIQGAGFSFLRLPMGASDLSLSNYSYDDMPPGQTDPALIHFSVAHDTAYIIPVLQQALSLNPALKIDATLTHARWPNPAGELEFGLHDRSRRLPLTRVTFAG
jgi:O-glycosyl hydrolase